MLAACKMPYPKGPNLQACAQQSRSAGDTQEAIDGEPQLRQEIKDDETVSRLVETAKKLEGAVSTCFHPCGGGCYW